MNGCHARHNDAPVIGKAFEDEVNFGEPSFDDHSLRILAIENRQIHPFVRLIHGNAANFWPGIESISETVMVYPILNKHSSNNLFYITSSYWETAIIPTANRINRRRKLITGI
jgi:hypothetical protein